MEGIVILAWVVCLGLGMLGRELYDRRKQAEDIAARRAQEDLGMERWHQQDFAAWDKEFHAATGKWPFGNGIQDLMPGKIIEGHWSQLYAPGLQGQFLYNQQVAMQQSLQQQAMNQQAQLGAYGQSQMEAAQNMKPQERIGGQLLAELMRQRGKH